MRPNINAATKGAATHQWNDETCSCGNDTCLCQLCGKVVCGELATWVNKIGNVCWICNDTRNPDTILRIAGGGR